jgi:hypothetical protein
MPGHLAAPTKWTDGQTRIEFTLRGREIAIHQDGKRLATTTVTGTLAEQLDRVKALENVKWGDGIYGPFGGATINGIINSQ